MSEYEFALAVCFSQGEGVPQDLKEAARLFKIASDGSLALCYYNGKGVPQEVQHCIQLIKWIF